MSDHRSSETVVEFSLSHYVQVKLTDFGRRALRSQHAKFYEHAPRVPEYELPEEDRDGWSRWQLWDLMNRLGEYCRGAPVPFETIIRIETQMRPDPESEHVDHAAP